jgi:hypothetical protein
LRLSEYHIVACPFKDEIRMSNIDMPASSGNYSGHLSPTDISQFIRLEQCERYLRLRLHEKSVGMKFMAEYGVSPQSIPPLLTRSGSDFEREIEQALAARYEKFNFAVDGDRKKGNDDNKKIVEFAIALAPGNQLFLLQPRLHVELQGWRLSGDVDLLRLERNDDGRLKILIVDIKSSTSVKVEHRLQVAFYHAMIARLFEIESVDYDQIETAILYRGPADTEKGIDEDAVAQFDRERGAAEQILSVTVGLLEIIAEPENYLESVRDLVTGPASAARRIAASVFEVLPYHLSYKCDGCLYNEFCMKWSAEKDDLSLLPYMTAQDKKALKSAGISTVGDLAHFKEFSKKEDAGADSIELIPAQGREELAKKLAATWPVGPRIDELVHRARHYRRWKKEQIESLSYIPNRGYGSLPYCDSDHNPNLIRIYIDAQHDYLHDRIYMLGALVVACEDGKEVSHRRRSIVHMTDGPPDHPRKEKRLFIDWINDMLRAIVDLAALDGEGKKRAPIHAIFFNNFEQRLLLDGLARNFSSVLGATPLYDFMTQLAAFDSPIATFLDQEIRELKNYPMVCQSLQAVAAFLKFDWNEGVKYREIFKEHMFDFWGKIDRDDGLSPWYTNRSRFNSQIPLEFSYTAWGRLAGEIGEADLESDSYQQSTVDLLKGFQARRLEALECIAHDFKGNYLTEKKDFDLPDLASFTDKARTFAHALDEFITIERHVELGAWKTTRHIAPERRVLMGETLIVSYHEEDQDPVTAERNCENERRRILKERLRTEFKAANPQARKIRLPKQQNAESEWSQDGMLIRLRLDTSGIDCSLDEALALSTFQTGKRLVLFPRLTCDERLPLEERKEFTPTPKQMLYGTRADLISINVERDESGKAVRACLEIELQKGYRASRTGFAFAAMDRPLIDGKLYTLDSDPNNFYGGWCAEVVEGLCGVEEKTQSGRNTLYDRITNISEATVKWPQSAKAGQARFLAGLDALHECGALHDFEPSKREYIGSYGAAPILLVQGPPGTGKSYSTAFALFARIQGAMAAGMRFHVFVSCKTHAATDVLMGNILEVQNRLKELRNNYREIFDRYIDEMLLEVPLFRMSPKETPPAGVIELKNGREKEKGEDSNLEELAKYQWCVVSATPGGIRNMVKEKWNKKGDLLGHYFCECLVLDEASQMSIPEAAMAALPLCPDGELIVVGDHRQMPPIVHHDWESEPRRTFQEYRSYESLFATLLDLDPPIVKFAESFRLHAAMAEFLRQEIYSKDGINYHSRKDRVLPRFEHEDEFVSAVLSPEHPIVVVVHAENESQTRNPFEQALVEPVLSALANPNYYALDAMEGLGVVVPHRMQRAAMQSAFPYLRTQQRSSGVGAEFRSAVDTVERFQGDERKVILVSVTESDREYLLASSRFLLDPRRLTVAMSRAKQKMILVASQSIFSLFNANEETFANLQMWKNLLRRACTVKLWEGERQGKHVEVWGGDIRKT